MSSRFLHISRALLGMGALVSVGTALFLPLTFVRAQDTGVGEDIGRQLQAAGGSRGAGFSDPVDPRVTAMLLIRSILRFIAVIVFCYMLYAGFRWMTAGGNDEQISEAKRTIRNCVIGLIIIMSSYSLTYFAITLAIGAPSNPNINAFLF